MDKKTNIRAVSVFILLVLVGTASAQNLMKEAVCSVINDVRDALMAIGPALVLVMFVYGGVRYVYGADDPGVRKSGKNTCIHAIIGGVLITLAAWVTGAGLGKSTCA
jgi:hypothetical protein